MSTTITHHALLLRPGHAHAQSHVVRSNRVVETEDRVSLYEDERLVYGMPARDVVGVVPCHTQREADDAARVHRETLAGAGAASAHLNEGGAVSRPRGGGVAASAIPAEGIMVVVEP